MRSIKATLFSLLALAAFPRASSAQSYDSSGNGVLNGTYYLRQVIYFLPDEEGNVDYANIQGTITFNGSGSYTFSGSFLDAEIGTVQTGITTTGTYVISASGEGYISAIYSAINTEAASTDLISGLVSPKGIFIGSSTENSVGYNDLFIAAPVGSTGATNATLNGTYSVAYMDPTYFPTTSAIPGGDAQFTMTADGQGNIGTINVTGYVSSNTSPRTETLSGVTYSFSNGAAQLNFGGNNTALIEGTELLYISPDGNFIFGGNYNGFDMFVGVRAATSNPANYNALYYQAGLDLDQAAVADGYYGLDSYFGAINAFTGGNIIGHQRENLDGAYDYTYYDTYTLNGDGTSTDIDFGQEYWSSSDGTIRIGYGNLQSQGYPLSLNVALQAPAFTGSGVYLNPTGMLNAASTAPFTAQLSPGEFLSLFGTDLAPSEDLATTFPLPDKLNGVQVTISGYPAPIDYVSPTQINVVVPYEVGSVAQIQVSNNGKTSNVVTQFVGADSAGVFTYQPEGGIGYAAALHSDGSVVTTSSPAQIGETIAVYLAGMGAVSGFPQDGAAAPSSPLDSTTATPTVYIDDSTPASTQAAVTFSGLAPTFAGLYQINVTIPSGVAAGDTALDISGGNSETVESILPVGTSTSDATPSARAKFRMRPMIHRHRLARPIPVRRSRS
jgi:uncharacterized protein (TIGR03437 family)